jgi:ribonuclease D
MSEGIKDLTSLLLGGVTGQSTGINAMANHSTKNYRDSGDVTVIGGELRIASGGKITAAGTQASAIADAETAHALNATFDDDEAEAALNALGTKLNSVLEALRGAAIIASS